MARFLRAAALALVIQLPPNLLFLRGFASVPLDFFAKNKKREATDAQQRQVERLVAEIVARAGVEAPAVWLTDLISRIAAGIFERMLIINPGFYYSLSKHARRGVIAHEIAHQYDQSSSERLVTRSLCQAASPTRRSSSICSAGFGSAVQLFRPALSS
jgi:Peptidase family M48